jgi:hypothetical protein
MHGGIGAGITHGDKLSTIGAVLSTVQIGVAPLV